MLSQTKFQINLTFFHKNIVQGLQWNKSDLGHTYSWSIHEKTFTSSSRNTDENWKKKKKVIVKLFVLQ